MSEYCRMSCDKCNMKFQNVCIDDDHRCYDWGRENQCELNPDFMLVTCRRTCKMCRM